VFDCARTGETAASAQKESSKMNLIVFPIGGAPIIVN
jgi:hypothetical protein